MRLSHVLPAFVVVFGFSCSGCGGGGEPTSIDSDELQSYVEENAAALAAEDAAMEAEEEADDADDDE